MNDEQEIRDAIEFFILDNKDKQICTCDRCKSTNTLISLAEKVLQAGKDLPQKVEDVASERTLPEYEKGYRQGRNITIDDCQFVISKMCIVCKEKNK